MFKVLGGETKGLRVRLYLARHKGDILAGALVAFFGGYATYLHGASSNYKRNLMAPYALHWMIMQQAKQAGFVYYDLYGINKKLWPGVTRFKIGFGGEEVVYPGAYDIVFKPVNYKIYKTLRFARRKLL
jgi:lipid II:glycine glycyltransferase (peptidoglycan interpeptide bridge formation enzyme)